MKPTNYRRSFCSLLIAQVLILTSRTQSHGEIWEKWSPGDKVVGDCVVIVEEVLDDSSMLVTPTKMFLDRNHQFESGLKVGPAGNIGGLMNGDPLIAREFGEREVKNTFLLKGVASESFFRGQVLALSGKFLIHSVSTGDGRTHLAASFSGKSTPPARDEKEEVFEEVIIWKTWRPRTVGHSSILAVTHRVIDDSSAMIVPLNNDDAAMSYDRRMELETKSRPPSDSRIQEICKAAYDRAFIVHSIDTRKLTDGALIRLDGLFRVGDSNEQGYPMVYQLAGAEKDLAIQKIRHSREKMLVLLKSGKTVEIAPEEFEKGDDGVFRLRYLDGSGEVERISVNEITSKSQSSIRKNIAQRRKSAK